MKVKKIKLLNVLEHDNLYYIYDWVKYVFVPQVSVKFGIGSSLKFLTNLVFHL